MSKNTPAGGSEDVTMQEYEFTCPECAQSVDVNEEMRNAILSNGCPICTANVIVEDFER